MADSRVSVASQALARLGEPSISSFEEDTDAAEKVAQLYETTILSLFSGYAWSFATVRKALNEDAAGTPINEWTRGFLMPPLRTDRVGKPLTVFNRKGPRAGAVFGYEIHGKWILTNERECLIEYIQRKDETQWPGYFTKLAVEALAAALALPITENQTKDQYHNQLAYGMPSELGRGGFMGAAMRADSTGDPTRGLLDDDDPMQMARFGGVF